jgi:hypothetical protein
VVVWYVLAYIYHILVFHSSTDGHLHWFPILTVVTCAVMNKQVQVSQKHADFVSLGLVLSSRISGACVVLSFVFWEMLLSTMAALMGIPADGISTTPDSTASPALFCFCFSPNGHSDWSGWHRTVVLTYVSLVAGNTGYFFMYLLPCVGPPLRNV